MLTRRVGGCSSYSGPLRFDLDVASGKWVNVRDPTDELLTKLEAELSQLTGLNVFLKE